MNSFHSRKIPAATAVAIALGAAAAQPALAQSQSGGDPKSPALQAGPVTLTFGGFVELASIYRNRNEVSDVGSDFGGLPLPTGSTAAQYNESEFRESARQSRISLLAQGEPYAGVKAESYLEADFLSAGVTSNSRESNSYTLRMRHYYARLVSDSGLDLTFGQTWSLVTLAKSASLSPHDQITPVGIDAQYVVGFNWTRNPQVRLVDHLSKEFSVGVSIESPQVVTSGGAGGPTGVGGATAAPYPAGTFTNTGDGAGLENSTTTYSTDTKPDVVVKVAADPGFGHYELYGLARFFTSSVAKQSSTATGGGVGFGVILPLAPKVLSFQLSGLAGRGIGRYGSGQLADVTERADGTISPIRAYQFLGGLTLTPTPDLQLYAYYGREQNQNNFQTFNASATSTICTGAAGTCYYGFGAPFGSTRKLEEVTVGQWYTFYKGVLGHAQFGLQAEYVQKDLFDTLAGAPGTSGNIFIGMASFRYYPYQ